MQQQTRKREVSAAGTLRSILTQTLQILNTGAMTCDVMRHRPRQANMLMYQLRRPYRRSIRAPLNEHRCARYAKGELMQKHGWRSMRSAKSNLAGPRPENL